MKAQLCGADGLIVDVELDVVTDVVELPVWDGTMICSRPVFGRRRFRRVFAHDDLGAIYQEIAE